MNQLMIFTKDQLRKGVSTFTKRQSINMSRS